MAKSAGQTAGGWRQTLTATIKQNPLPAAAAGLSIAWLYMNRTSGGSSSLRVNPSAEGYGTYYMPAAQRSTSGEATHAIGEVAGQAQHAAGQMVGKAQETVGHVAGQAQETGEQLVEGVQEQAARAQSFLQRQLHENPLLVGAVAVAVGGVLAGTIPVTPREDQMLGATRDRLMGTAKEMTQETMGKVGSVVQEAASTMKDEAQAQHLIPSEKSSE